MKKHLPVLLCLLVWGCKGDQKKIYYPDCLTDVTTNVKVIASCGDVFVAFETAPGQALTLSINAEKAGLSTTCSHFSYPQDSAVFRIDYYTYHSSPDSTFFNWCTDAIVHELGSSLSWTPMSGEVTASVSIVDPNASPCEGYLLALEAKDLQFVNPDNGDTATFGRLAGRDLNVGFCIP